LAALKQRFNMCAPNWLYALLVMVYWKMHPHRPNIVLIPQKDGWVAIKGDLRFYAPDPRVAKVFSPPSHSYERYFGVKCGDTVLDVGACIGEFTIPFARKVGRKGIVIAIEPHPKNIVCLRRNIIANNLDNVWIVTKAVSNCKKISKLYGGKTFEEHSLISNVVARNASTIRSENEYIKIPVDTLDNIISNLGITKIDFMKMDIEGAEIEALEGAKRTLNITEKLVIAAYHLIYGEKTVFRVQRLLENSGFLTRVTDDGLVFAWK